LNQSWQDKQMRKLISRWILSSTFVISSVANAAVEKPAPPQAQVKASPERPKSLRERLQARMKETSKNQKSSLIFDLPVTYNKRVSYWINHFQTKGKNWFSEWLELATIYLPLIQAELKAEGMPQDLAFMVMIESGFRPNAISHADAVGPWQFIKATGNRYGLRTAWWLDERRDLIKSTRAAIRYMRDLNREFGSWYLVAASYNMGENGLRRKIKKHRTNNYWELSRLGAIPDETIDYVPKILAAMMITKSPKLYGFRDLAQYEALSYDVVSAPGGTDLKAVADHLKVTTKSLLDLNAELTAGHIPASVDKHLIRIPKGAVLAFSQFLQK
jgi:membrane-bound lytic murein transglycosylase D